jgi:hypothetical protein
VKSRSTNHAPEILHHGSLMTYRDNRRERCFGYLFHFPGRGVYEPTFGRLDATAGEASTHNQLLSRAEIEGLDQNCPVGLGGMFYTKKADSHTVVATWLGEEVSREVRVRSNVLTFTRKGMTFRGRLRPSQDCFCFKRIQ